MLRLDDGDCEALQPEEDAFAEAMRSPNAPIVATRDMLRELNASEVLVRRWPNAHLPAQYFRVIDPLVDIVCGPCGHFFEADEYEMLSLAHGKRPFSWAPLDSATPDK